jgi:outer membrane murein-binding lipoprotein Lpp
MIRIFTVVLGFLALAGCASSGPYVNPLSADIRESVFVQSIEVDTGQLKPTNSADVIEKRKLMAEEIKRQLGETFRNRPSGAKPTKMVVKLTDADTAFLRGDVNLIDGATGQNIVTYNVLGTVKRTGFSQLVQGKDSKIRQVVEVFNADLTDSFFN